MRTISDKQGLTLKAATRRALDMAGGGDAFQHVTRVKAGNLSKYGSNGEDNLDKFMPIDVAVEADLEANSPIIVSAMAEMLGYKLVPIAGGTESVADALAIADVLKIANEMGDVVRATTEALADGHVDGAERKEITRQIDEAMQALKALMKKVGA